MSSLAGFIVASRSENPRRRTALGIAARSGIMLVSHYRHLEAEEDQPFGKELVLFARMAFLRLASGKRCEKQV